jgi:hypothetical protein
MEGAISQHGKQSVPETVGSRESGFLFLGLHLTPSSQLLTPDRMAAFQNAQAGRAGDYSQNVGRELMERLNPFKRVLKAMI